VGTTKGVLGNLEGPPPEYVQTMEPHALYLSLYQNTPLVRYGGERGIKAVLYGAQFTFSFSVSKNPLVLQGQEGAYDCWVGMRREEVKD
jgi:hypothetical protein